MPETLIDVLSPPFQGLCMSLPATKLMLNLKPLEQISITLLPRMLRLNINNHLLMPVASRHNAIREIMRPTNQTGRSHPFRLNLLALSIQNLVDVENGQETGKS